MANVNVELVNFDTVVRTVKMFPEVLKNKEVRKGLKEGGRILTAQGKINLRSALKNRPISASEKARRAKRKRMIQTFRVKVKRGNKGVISGIQSHAAHLVDQGTKVRWTSKGQNRGRVTATYFWTKVRQSSSKEAEAKRPIIQGITEAIQKLNNR